MLPATLPNYPRQRQLRHTRGNSTKCLTCRSPDISRSPGEVSQHAQVASDRSACPAPKQTLNLTSPGKGRGRLAPYPLRQGRSLALNIPNPLRTPSQQAPLTSPPMRRRPVDQLPAKLPATLPSYPCQRQLRHSRGNQTDEPLGSQATRKPSHPGPPTNLASRPHPHKTG